MGVIVIESIDSMRTIYLLDSSHRDNAPSGRKYPDTVNLVRGGMSMPSGYVSACRVNAVCLCSDKVQIDAHDNDPYHLT